MTHWDLPPGEDDLSLSCPECGWGLDENVPEEEECSIHKGLLEYAQALSREIKGK